MKYLIIIISFIFLLSCTKSGKNVTLKGRVLNPITGDGIAGAEIWLQKTAGGYNGGWKTVKKAVSNGDGNFVLEKIGFAGYAAVAGAFQGEYFELGWTQDQGATYTGNFKIWTKIGKTMHADYYAVPYAHIQLKIENVNCQGPADHFVLYAEGTEADMSVNGVMIDKMGCYQYTAPSHSKIPMGKRYYRWEVTRSGVTNTYYDTLYFAENEYKTFEINY